MFDCFHVICAWRQKSTEGIISIIFMLLCFNKLLMVRPHLMA